MVAFSSSDRQRAILTSFKTEGYVLFLSIYGVHTLMEGGLAELRYASGFADRQALFVGSQISAEPNLLTPLITMGLLHHDSVTYHYHGTWPVCFAMLHYYSIFVFIYFFPLK